MLARLNKKQGSEQILGLSLDKGHLLLSLQRSVASEHRVDLISEAALNANVLILTLSLNAIVSPVLWVQYAFSPTSLHRAPDSILHAKFV